MEGPFIHSKMLLLATATIRHEGSTKYGIDNKWGNFKSLSFAWRISDMGFMSNLVSKKIVDDLKLRVGYGETGRDVNSSLSVTGHLFRIIQFIWFNTTVFYK